MVASLCAVGSSVVIMSHEEKAFVAHTREHTLLYTGD
jgi:hypothetical protein